MKGKIEREKTKKAPVGTSGTFPVCVPKKGGTMAIVLYLWGNTIYVFILERLKNIYSCLFLSIYKANKMPSIIKKVYSFAVKASHIE